MKTITLTFIGLVCLFGTSSAVDTTVAPPISTVASEAVGHSFCQSSVNTFCRKEYNEGEVLNCTAQFGRVFDMNTETQRLVEHQLKYSMEYLLMSSHFGEWNINRKGFQDYFSKLSDASWDDAVTLVQHLIKRGGKLQKSLSIDLTTPGKQNTHKYGELYALSKALDMEKHISEKYLGLIKPGDYDAEFAHFLADEVSDKKVLRIKHLSNHVNSLYKAVKSAADSSFVFYLYDTQILN